MRIRAVLAAVAAALLVPVLAPAPAHAGTGTANWCGDGIHGGGMDIPILTWPITVGIEVYSSPTNTSFQQLRICFSDTPPGQPSQITGGAIAVGVWPDTGTVTPGALVRLSCMPDLGSTGVFPTCNTPVAANVVPGEVAVTTPNSGICLVSLGSGCQAYLPGVKVYTNNDPGRPLLGLNVLGVPVNVAAPPPNCIAVIVSCP